MPACNGATARFPTYGQTRTATTISCNISSKSTASNIAASYTLLNGDERLAFQKL